MNNTSIVTDALALCLTIYNATPPNDKWIVVNIARSSFPTFTFPSNSEIPAGFGYNYDNVPRFLDTEGVIEAMTSSKWFVGFSTGNLVSYDSITPVALNKGYFNKNQKCNYYWKYRSYGNDFGPKSAGQFAVLINIKALRDFYSKYSPAANEEPSTQNSENKQDSQKRVIDDALIEIIKNEKLKRICVEINTTPEQNVLSLSQSIGEAIKWAIWVKAKGNQTKLKENTGLEALLDEAIRKTYFKSNASIRFLKEFKNNFMKTAFDMVRHDESYIPDLTILNSQIDALEHILKEIYPDKSTK